MSTAFQFIHIRILPPDFAQHHIDSLDLTVNSVAYLQKLFPGMTEQQYRQHLGAFGITVRRRSDGALWSS